jgi:hypothetical protein
MYKINLDIPADTLNFLSQLAVANNQTIEALILQWVKERAEKVHNNPLLKLNSELTDCVEKQDENTLL